MQSRKHQIDNGSMDLRSLCSFLVMFIYLFSFSIGLELPSSPQIHIEPKERHKEIEK